MHVYSVEQLDYVLVDVTDVLPPEAIVLWDHQVDQELVARASMVILHAYTRLNPPEHQVVLWDVPVGHWNNTTYLWCEGRWYQPEWNR